MYNNKPIIQEVKMCGRVILSFDYETIKEILLTTYNVSSVNISTNYPRYNIAPGQNLISIIHDGKNFRAGELHFGFVPSWAKDKNIGYSLINARSESVYNKPTFKQSFFKKRCLIIANGFYEWKKVGKEKQPYCFKLKDNGFFTMAGLWTTYCKTDGNKLHSCAIITTEANSLMRPIHHRMPVIIPRENEQDWLNPLNNDINILKNLLVPYSSKKMYSYPVSQKVNSVKIDSPDCILPLNNYNN